MTRFAKFGLCVLILVLLIPLSWRMAGIDPADLNPRRPWELRQPDSSAGQPAMVIPRPMGPENAPVKIRAYVTTQGGCDVSTIPIVRGFVFKYEGKVRAQFVDMSTEQGGKEASAAKISCKSGVTINGQSQFRLPEEGNRLIMLNGPVGEHDYTPNDLEAIIVHLLGASPPAPKPNETPEKTGAKR
jgi:hypothetical protein